MSTLALFAPSATTWAEVSKCQRCVGRSPSIENAHRPYQHSQGIQNGGLSCTVAANDHGHVGLESNLQFARAAKVPSCEDCMNRIVTIPCDALLSDFRVDLGRNLSSERSSSRKARIASPAVRCRS